MASMRRLLMFVAALALLAACDSGQIGQSCQAGATEDVCVEGAICTPDQDDRADPPTLPNEFSYTCRAICEIEADCDPGFTCRRVTGSMVSSCQPDGETDTADAGP